MNTERRPSALKAITSYGSAGSPSTSIPGEPSGIPGTAKPSTGSRPREQALHRGDRHVPLDHVACHLRRVIAAEVGRHANCGAYLGDVVNLVHDRPEPGCLEMLRPGLAATAGAHLPDLEVLRGRNGRCRSDQRQGGQFPKTLGFGRAD